jgi:hypothetical protein
MPINKGNGVLVGEICKSCGQYAARTCRFNTYKIDSTLEYKTDRPDNLCMEYQPIEEDLSSIQLGSNEKMKKEARLLKDTELNIELYKKIKAMKDDERKKLFVYWEHLFPKDYAKEMVTDHNESAQKQPDSKGKLESLKTRKERKDEQRKNKFPDSFNK